MNDHLLDDALLEIHVQLRPLDLIWIREWGRIRDYLGLGINFRAYMKGLNLALYFHCRRWTLILCAGTLDPRMHQCVACTKVVATLLLTYPHVLE